MKTLINPIKKYDKKRSDYKKRNPRNSFKKKSNTFDNKCYKCGKGHYANKCLHKVSRKKINE